MARTPWLKIDPIIGIGKNSQQGNKTVYGIFGKIVSWVWVLGGIFLLFYGFISLRKLGEIQSNLANILLAPVLASWIAAIATIGDHRFRIPTMSLSLVLQMVAILTLKNKISKR
jgi:hypothetical protein